MAAAAVTRSRSACILVCGALMLGGCGSAATGGQTPSASSHQTPARTIGLPAHGRIAFTLDGQASDSGDILCTIEPNGTGLLMLTPATRGFAGNANPAWTSTGDRILFSRASPPGAAYPNWTASNLFSMDRNGGSIQQLTFEPAHVYDESPAISPDGTLIAFDRFDLSGHRSGIYLMHADGSHAVRITTPPASAAGGDLYPTFSPDGTQLAFVRDGIPDGDGAIYVVGIDGSGLRQITPTTFVDATRPHWSPDGSKLLFGTPWSDHTAMGRDIYVVNSDGSGLIALTHEYDPDWAENPAWSPDGRMIVFDEFDDNSHFVGLVVMRADGSHPRMIWHPAPESDIFPQGPVWGTAP